MGMRFAHGGLLIAGSIGGLALAFAAGRVTAPSAPPDAATHAPKLTTATPTAHESPSSGERVAPVPPSIETEGTASVTKSAGDQLGELVPDASAQQRADADARAAGIRAQAEASARGSERAAARAVAQEIEKERRFLADQALGGTMELLRSLDSSNIQPFTLVEDAAAFGRHFERHVVGPEVDGAAPASPRQPKPGSVLRFPPGLHTLSVSSWGRANDFPADIVLEGAGRDRTVVRVDEFNANGEVRNLTFRDLTLDAGDNYLTDHRSPDPTTIRFERCRVIGFDMGAGGSVMLAARTAAVYATDTRFEAGYGRSPGSGNLFRVGNGLLARLERCVFVGPFRSVWNSDRGGTLVFDSCRFENVTVPLESPPTGVRFTNCKSVDLSSEAIFEERLQWQLTAMLDESNTLTVDGAAGQIPKDIDGCVTLSFPAGIFALRPDQGVRDHEGPLVIRGQGRDATLIRVEATPKSREVVVRDATLDLGSRDIVASELQLGLFERVRILGWDSGAGGSTALSLRSSACVVLRDSEVLDGFGRSPGRGTVASLNAGVILCFERSRLDLRGSELGLSGGSIRFVESSATGLRSKELEGPRWKRCVTSIHSTFTAGEPDGSSRVRRSLTELNPQWSTER